jgi:hypothetical protein
MQELESRSLLCCCERIEKLAVGISLCVHLLPESLRHIFVLGKPRHRIAQMFDVIIVLSAHVVFVKSYPSHHPNFRISCL